MFKFLLPVALLLSPMPLVARTAGYAIDPAHSLVTARVAFLGIGSKTASFPRLDGAIALSGGELSRLDVRIDASSLEAGDSLTQNRLKSDAFFDVAHYPTVTFAGRALTRTGPQSGTIDGTLTARGVTRPASLAVHFSRPIEAAARGPVHISATTEIDRRDFGMTAWSLIVGRRVAIAIEADLTPMG